MRYLFYIVHPSKYHLFKYTINELKKHLNGKAEVSKEIWKIINLELWFREFID